MELLLYAPSITPRLKYISDFIFTGLMHTDFSIIHNIEEFKKFNGIKIYYGNENTFTQAFSIGNSNLLFEKEVNEKNIACFTHNDYKAFFKQEGFDFPFDIFSATFYLLSRYEEYLPHDKDEYGRYAHTNSLAFKENFLHLPLINIWVKDLAEVIKNKFPSFTFDFSPFTFIPTYDIDIAFSYKHKGWLRNIGGFLKSPSLKRIKTLSGLQKDPFDTYEYLNQLHDKNNLKAHYFFLVAKRNSKYDKNILPHKDVMIKLLQNHVKKYTVGIHPSWQSGEDIELLKEEKKQLELITNSPVTKSRQHYIRFNLPEGYQQLIQAGITDDYSMGYGTINGFRASVASPFYWYDLEKEEQTQLRIHPFCFMEANAFYEQKLTAEQAYEEIVHYFIICKQVKGQMITIWHNDFFSSAKKYKGWKEIYEKFIAQVQQ